MNYKLALSKRVIKFLKTCDKRIKKSFFDKAEIITKNPLYALNKLDIKILVGEKDCYRLRI